MKPLSLSFILLPLFATVATAQEKQSFRLRFNKGEVHEMMLTLDQAADQNLHDVKIHTTQTISVEYTFTVDDVDDQGIATVSVHYNSMSFHCKSPTGELSYDSTQSAGYVPAVASGLVALVGQGYSLKISAGGSVIQVSGLDALLKTALAKLSLPEGPARAAAELDLKQRLDEQNMKSSLSSVFAPFPNHPIAVGESWYSKTQLNLALPLTVETTWTFARQDNASPIIDVVGRAATAPDSSVDLGRQSKMTYDLQGELHGQIQIDATTGWPVHSTITQTLVGNATVLSPVAPTQVVPVTVQSTLKVEQK
jgi:hypothetical protein